VTLSLFETNQTSGIKGYKQGGYASYKLLVIRVRAGQYY